MADAANSDGPKVVHARKTEIRKMSDKEKAAMKISDWKSTNQLKAERQAKKENFFAWFESKSSRVTTDFQRKRSRVTVTLNLFLILLMLIFQGAYGLDTTGSNWNAAVGTLVLLVFSLIMAWSTEYTDFAGFVTALSIGLVPVFWQLFAASADNTSVLVWFILPVMIQQILIFSFKWSLVSIVINYGLFWVAYGINPVLGMSSPDDVVLQITLMSLYGLVGCFLTNKDMGVLHDCPRRSIKQFIYRIDSTHEEARAVFAALCYPPPSVTFTKDRWRAKVGALLTLISVIMSVVWLAISVNKGWNDEKGGLLITTILFHLISYAMTRTKLFKWGMGLFVLQPCWYYLLYLGLVPQDMIDGTFVIVGPVYMAVSLFIGSFYLHLAAQAVLSVIFVIALIVMPYTTPALAPYFQHTAGVFLTVALIAFDYNRRMRSADWEGKYEEKEVVELSEIAVEGTKEGNGDAKDDTVPKESFGAKLADCWRYTSPLLVTEEEQSRARFTTNLDLFLLLLVLLFQAFYGPSLSGSNWIAAIGTFCFLIASYALAKTTEYINLAGLLTAMSVSLIPVFWQFFTHTLEGMYVLVWFIIPVVIAQMAIHDWKWNLISIIVNYALFWVAYAISIMGELDDIAIQISLMSVFGLVAVALKHKDATLPYDRFRPRLTVPQLVRGGPTSTEEARAVWAGLIYPSAALIGSKDRFRAKLAAVIMLVVFVINLVWLGRHAATGWEDGQGTLLVVALIFSAISYLLTRTKYYRVGIALFVFQPAWYYVIRIGVATTSQEYAVIGPGYMAVGIFFGSLFISMWGMIPLKVIILVSSFAAPDVMPYKMDIGYTLSYTDLAHSVGVVFFTILLTFDFAVLKKELQAYLNKRKAPKGQTQPVQGAPAGGVTVDMSQAKAAQDKPQEQPAESKGEPKKRKVEPKQTGERDRVDTVQKKTEVAHLKEWRKDMEKKEPKSDEDAPAPVADEPSTPKATPITKTGDKPEAVTPTPERKPEPEPEPAATDEPKVPPKEEEKEVATPKKKKGLGMLKGMGKAKSGKSEEGLQKSGSKTKGMIGMFKDKSKGILDAVKTEKEEETEEEIEARLAAEFLKKEKEEKEEKNKDSNKAGEEKKNEADGEAKAVVSE